MSRDERSLRFLLFVIAVLFVLQQSGLQVIDYLPRLAIRTAQAILVGSFLLLALWGMANYTRLPKFHARLIAVWAALNVFYGIGDLLFGSIAPLFHFESIVFALAVIPLIRDWGMWVSMMRGLFWGGIVLMALNMVPLLHWAGWVDLRPEIVPRLIETDVDLSHLDPYSFGIFGHTENHLILGRFSGRLQGWSLEPLHWGYFVLLTLACGLLLQTLHASRQRKLFYRMFFVLIAVHAYFVNSASVYLTLAIWFVSMAVFVTTRRWNWLAYRQNYLFLALMISIGLILPFLLLLIPHAEQLFYTEQVIGKGSNWESKLGFFQLGSQLFTRFLPMDMSHIEVSHNLILSTYITYGYFLIIPLFGFILWYCRRAVQDQPLGVAAASLLTLVTHLFLAPSFLFYPSGVLFMSFAMVVPSGYLHSQGVSSNKVVI